MVSLQLGRGGSSVGGGGYEDRDWSKPWGECEVFEATEAGGRR